jgi:hypothetical protein
MIRSVVGENSLCLALRFGEPVVSDRPSLAVRRNTNKGLYKRGTNEESGRKYRSASKH